MQSLTLQHFLAGRFCPILDATSQEINFIDKSRSELRSGLVELGGFNSSKITDYGELMLKQLPTEITDNPPSGKNNNIVKIYWHPMPLLLGFVIGAWLAIFAYDIYPLFFAHNVLGDDRRRKCVRFIDAFLSVRVHPRVEHLS
jgi:hypothetical protein